MVSGRSSRGWTRLLVEAVLVVGSVLLALALDDWREQRNNAELVRQTLANVQREIEENRAEIEEVLPYHRALLDSLRGPTPPNRITARSAFIQNSAWEAAQAVGAVPYMDVAVVAAVSRTQETQRQYQSAVETITEVGLLGTFGAGGEGFSLDRIPRGLALIVKNLTVLEERLLAHYEDALAQL